MVLSFYVNIEIYYIYKTKLCLTDKKYAFAQESVYVQGILSIRNELDHLFLNVHVNTCRHILNNGAPPAKFFHGYNLLFPCINSVSSETEWVP